jgi:hypothetical protein
MTVLDINSQAIGKVANTDRNRFEITTPAAQSVWVSTDIIYVTGRHSVELICPRTGIDRYRAQ